MKDTTVRKIIQFTFILCYIVFMLASIDHIAAFFNNFEPGGGGIRSYALAGAFDVTALVTMTGLMFFRKSMPWYIQCIVGIFILGIAGYSFIMNWEYARHFQGVDFTMYPTGDTKAVYDNNNVLHYVPVMKQSVRMTDINPFLASGFTILSLIYSVVAEFFGTKPPSIKELKERENYLKETAAIHENIKQLETQGKGKSLIQRMKETAVETKTAWNEVTKKEETIEETVEETSQETSQESAKQPERNTDELEVLPRLENIWKAPGDEEENSENNEKREKKSRNKKEENDLVSNDGELPSWLSTGGSTISLDLVVKLAGISRKKLNHRVETKQIRATKNKEIVYKDSLIKWMRDEGILEILEHTATNRVPTPESTSERNQEESIKQVEDNVQESIVLLTEHVDETADETADESHVKELVNV